MFKKKFFGRPKNSWTVRMTVSDGNDETVIKTFCLKKNPEDIMQTDLPVFCQFMGLEVRANAETNGRLEMTASYFVYTRIVFLVK